MGLSGFVIAAVLIMVAAVVSVLYLKMCFKNTRKNFEQAECNEDELDDGLYDWDAAPWPSGFVFDEDSMRSSNIKRSEIMRNLEQVDKSNPKKRAANSLDKWFDTHIADLCKSVHFLTYIAKYGYLTERFIQRIKEQPELNTPLLQMKLCSVCQANFSRTYHALCTNLLWDYLQTNDLSEEIKKTISKDERFVMVWKLYLNTRK